MYSVFTALSYYFLHLLPILGLYGPGCRTALPKEGRTQLDILSEMGRGTSLDIYLGGADQRSMDLDLLRTVASQARGFLYRRKKERKIVYFLNTALKHT
jgi:hypothetical protein